MDIEDAKRLLALYFSKGQTDSLFGKWDIEVFGDDAVLFMNGVSGGPGSTMYLVRNGRVGIVNLSVNTIDEIYELLGTQQSTPNPSAAPQAPPTPPGAPPTLQY